jgi:hypothetical protein
MAQPPVTHLPDDVPPDVPPDDPPADGVGADPGLDDLSTADLEKRLGCLAARIAAAECEFLLLLAEFDAREGWGRSGMKSTAHWLAWRTGLRLGVARERVRIARSLRDLPLVRGAFAQGRLSYCKVRALSRVATPPTEADLLDIALGSSGAQLERVVRAWRTCLVPETSASRHLRRGLRRREEDDGSVVFTLRVAPEEAMVVDRAVAAARAVVLDDDGRPVETPEEAALADVLTDEPPAVRAEADAFLLVAESFLATGPLGGPGDSTLVMVHADLADLAGHADVAETSAQRADGSADPRPEGVPAETSDAALPPEQVSLSRRPPVSVLPDGQRLSASTVLRMLCHSPAQLMIHARDGRPLDLGRTRRHANLKQRRALRTRDGGCRFPGCTQRRRLIPHHVHWWSSGGRTDLDLLVLVCPTHHRAVHEVGYTVSALGNGRFLWRRPTGETIPEAPGVTDAPRAGGHVSAGDRLPPVEVTPLTGVPTWGGERLDLDHLIGGMAANALNRAGHRLGDIPYPDLDPALRAAVGWPEPAPPPTWHAPSAA